MLWELIYLLCLDSKNLERSNRWSLTYAMNFFFVMKASYLSALSLYVERLWICEVDIKTFVLVQSYNRFFVLIIKWGKLILRFVLITLALLLGFQVIFINVAFHSCRSSGLFFWEDFRAYWYSPTSIIRISRLSILFSGPKFVMNIH